MQHFVFVTRAIAGLLVSVAAIGAQAQSASPEGKVAINYNRCDNDYEGWGLHTWKNPGMPLPGVEWAKPLMPTGKSDFGVVWQMDLAAYGSSGMVNYIIYKGETKEQGGRDMKFDAKTSPQIWVNSGDRKIYTSLDDAKKGREEKPCE